MGDVFTFIGLMSDEANMEGDKYFQSPVSMVSTSGKLIRGLGEGAMVKFTFFTMGYMPPQTKK